MARKPTDKQLFKMKNEWLGQFYEQVKPKEFYRAVFPEGSFEREGHPEDEKCNGVLTVIEGEKADLYKAAGAVVYALRKSLQTERTESYEN